MTAFSALPALVGVLIGIGAFVHGLCSVVAVAGVSILVPFVLMRVGRRLLSRRPRLGLALIECWIIAAIGVTAVATAFVTWIGLGTLPRFLGDASKLSADAQKTIFGNFLGAVTTYVAVVWTKDIGDATGYFWPSTQFKKGMEQAYTAMTTKPPNGGVVYQAMFMDVVEGHGNLGWGFSARWTRAGILADFLG